jgi:deoxyribodipyrimidine photolyase-related protein
LHADLERLRPTGLVMTAPGDWRVLQAIKGAAQARDLPLDLREYRHFYCSVREFAAYARGRKSLRMEYVYRELRKRHDVLMQGDAPDGGQWNFDADNRGAFDAPGPGAVPPRAVFAPDALTREVIALVEEHFAAHPGRLDGFAWPVTRAQALIAMQRFITERLPLFGRYQDAMWPGEPWLYHAHLLAALNLKLLQPREVVDAAVAAYHAGAAPLAGVEGFVRQILGWREYVRGIYWTRMPGYAKLNALDAREDLPAWYWTGATDMACLRDAITQTLAHGYAHHIQRLMVTGLFALLYGVQPRQVHAWYLAVYVDAVEWVELPNTLGMSQYADGGLMAAVDDPADEMIRLVAAGHGLDLSAHRSRPIDPELMRWADLVLVMEGDHRRHLLQLAPSSAGKVYLLGHWGGIEIPDPYRQGREVCEAVYHQIATAVELWLLRL